jgi:DNA-binding HxlR family transcriptional regulator
MEDPAELFEAISHPTRIKILKILENQPSSFASLKRQLGIDSSGNLDHHLKKLGQLIRMRKDGLYGLTDTGKEALTSVGAVESWKETEHLKIKKLGELPKLVTFLLALGTIAFLVALFQVGTFGFGVQSIFLLFVFLMLILAFPLSAVGLIKRKTWGWSLTAVQAVIFLGYAVFEILNETILIQQYPELAYGSLSFQFLLSHVVLAVFGAIEGLVLFVALRRNTKEFFGIQDFSSHQKSVLVAGMLVMIFGTVVTYTVVGRPVVVDPFLNIGAGFAIFFGGIAILMEKYTLGGAIGFCLFPIPSFLALLPLVLHPDFLGIPFYMQNILIILIPYILLPAVALLLIRSNLKTALSDFFSQIWRQL